MGEVFLSEELKHTWGFCAFSRVQGRFGGPTASPSLPLTLPAPGPLQPYTSSISAGAAGSTEPLLALSLCWKAS